MSFAEAMKVYFPLAVEIDLMVAAAVAAAAVAVVVFAVVEVTGIDATFENTRGISATIVAE